MTYQFTPEGIEGFLSLIDPAEIGIGVAIGRRPDDSRPGVIEAVERIPNIGAYEARGKSLQDSWSYEAERLDEIERRAQRAAGRDLLGLVHTHRHGKTMPSTLDWRRQRYSHAFGAVYHPASGIVTLTDRGRPNRPGRIVDRRAICPDNSDLCNWIASFCANPADLNHPKLASVHPLPIVRYAGSYVPPAMAGAA